MIKERQEKKKNPIRSRVRGRSRMPTRSGQTGGPPQEGSPDRYRKCEVMSGRGMAEGASPRRSPSSPATLGGSRGALRAARRGRLETGREP